MSRLLAKLEYAFMFDSFHLFFRKKEFDGRVYYPKPIEMVEFDPHKFRCDPFISGDQIGIDAKEFCQAIMDEAWNNGMRPTGFTDIKNETIAIKYHLEDMRKLVFKGK